MHQQYMGTARHVRMNGHREDEFIVFAVEVVEVILPVVTYQPMIYIKGLVILLSVLSKYPQYLEGSPSRDYWHYP
jgi:hypothetical protein